MIKSSFLILIFIFIAEISAAQKIGFSDSKSSFTEPLSSSKLIEIGVRVNGSITSDIIVYPEILNQSSVNSDDFRLITKILEFKAGTSNPINNLIIEIKGDTVKEETEIIALKLTTATSAQLDSDKNLHLIAIINAEKPVTKEQDNPNYKLLLGANFDLNDGLDANNFYKELSVFTPNLIKKKLFKTENTIGFYGGIFQTKSVSYDSIGTRGITATRPISQLSDTSLLAIRTSYNIKTNETYNNLGLYFAPIFKWRAFSGEKLNTYIGGHFEYIRRKVIYKYSYEPTVTDSLLIKIDKNSPISFPRINLSERRTVERYDSYFGLTVPFSYIDRGYDLNIKPIAGMAIISNPTSRNSVTIQGNAILFYSMQFNLTAINSGFNLGGEIRGFYGSKSAIATIHLSKVLSVKKIGEALVGSSF